jgi:hypothetical protein
MMYVTAGWAAGGASTATRPPENLVHRIRQNGVLMHEAVIAAVERVMRERFAASVPLEDDDE